MKKVNIDRVYHTLEKDFEKVAAPVVDLIQIQTQDPFKVLVATILSARTKDQTTAEVCEKLFKKINTYRDFNNYTEKQIRELIFPIGFYKNKASYLKKLPATLEKLFKGVIPDTVDELVKLPGVGRKTANLVVAVAFQKPAVCVDIHVHRIMNRLGYIKTKTPLESEMALRKKMPEKYWVKFNSFFVSYGQRLCKPINPECNRCIIYDQCNRVDVKTKHAKN